MFNQKKLIFVLFLFSCILLSMTFVSANNNIADDDSVFTDSLNNSLDNEIKSNLDQSDMIFNDEYDKYNKSFNDLDNKINSDLNKSYIILNDDYLNDRKYREGIIINHSVTIDGQGHVIDANFSSRIFYINANNVVLKNIVFKKSLSDMGGAVYCNGTNITIINSTFSTSYVYKFNGGAAIIYKYNGTVINSTFINTYVYRGVDAFNFHNETISYAMNCEEEYDSISFEKGYNVTIINSTFTIRPELPLLFEWDVQPVFNSSNVNISDNDNSITRDNIKKVYVKLNAKNKVFNKKIKIKKYSVVLKDNHGKVMKNTWLTLKIKGKLFKAKTNKAGKAVFKIKKLNKKGKYKAAILFKGNNLYDGVSKKIKIIIK